VGEISFWYRPTRVVPDQRPLNGRCCCCMLFQMPNQQCQSTEGIKIHLQAGDISINWRRHQFAKCLCRLRSVEAVGLWLWIVLGYMLSPNMQREAVCMCHSQVAKVTVLATRHCSQCSTTPPDSEATLVQPRCDCSKPQPHYIHHTADMV